MPRQRPDHKSGLGKSSPVSRLAIGKSQCISLFDFLSEPMCRFLRGATPVVATFAGWFSASTAIAQESIAAEGSSLRKVLTSLETHEILMLAIFGGAMSFALLSAFWLIRERSRVVSDNQNLKRSLADLRVSNDRNAALANTDDQRTVVWNGPEEKPIILGSLPTSSGAPDKHEFFLQFGKWIDEDFAGPFERSLRELRNNAIGFQTVIKSRGGGVLEVRGTTSGSYALVKFCDLHGVQEEYSKLKVEHENLSRSFDQIEQLLGRIPVPVWLKNAEGRLSWVNTAYARSLEMTDPTAVVSANIDLFDAEQRETISRGTTPEDLFDEILPATVAGDRRKLQVYSAASESGSAGIAFDKSDVDEVRRLLKEATDGHARMLDQMATAVAMFDRSQRLIFHNNSFKQLWKLDPGLLDSGPSNGDVLDAMRDGKLLPDHPDWRKWREGQLGIYTAIEPVEDWWHLLDGQTIRVVASPRSEGGSTWIFENVTERLTLESNYNALMRVQGETLDHLNEAVAVFGSNGQLKLFNPALEALWQTADITVQEGLHISRVIDAWEVSVKNTDALQAILGNVTGFDDARSEQEGRMQLSDGRSLSYAIVPLPDSQTMLTFVDVTASVNFEKALHERAEALEASDLLKSKFIKHVSYILRVPLTSISGFGEILRSEDIGKLNSKQCEYVTHINDSALTLQSIVDDILDLASIDAGTMILDYETVSLDDMVKTVIEKQAGVMREKGLKASVDIAAESEVIIADPGRLSQILGNVISNAINFSPDGGMIALTAKRDGMFHEIRIADEGPGIDASEVDAIFDRFETRSTSPGKGGSGLGLSIVRSFLELHGGSATIDTSHTLGTCFVCRLPITPPEVELDGDFKQGAAAVA